MTSSGSGLSNVIWWLQDLNLFLKFSSLYTTSSHFSCYTLHTYEHHRGKIVQKCATIFHLNNNCISFFSMMVGFLCVALGTTANTSMFKCGGLTCHLICFEHSPTLNQHCTPAYPEQEGHRLCSRSPKRKWQEYYYYANPVTSNDL